MITAAKKEVWLQHLLKSTMLREWKKSLLLRDDNSEVYYLIINETRNLNDRTKHIDIRHHFIRKKIQQKEIIIQMILSEENVADVLTKSLVREIYEKMWEMLSVRSSSSDWSYCCFICLFYADTFVVWVFCCSELQHLSSILRCHAARETVDFSEVCRTIWHADQAEAEADMLRLTR